MSAIKPGDLVLMVARICDCPVCTAPLGIPFVVEAVVGNGYEGIRCVTRNRIVAMAPAAQGFSDSTGHFQIPVSALKKIDPLPAEDDIEHEEGLTV